MALWIFGYGSLMWRPGFEPAARTPAMLSGWHRKFCVRSRRNRGTADLPGLVLGLAPGEQCRGIAYRVRDGEEDEVRAYLYEREVPVYPYEEAWVEVATEEGGTLTALTYLPEPGHPDFVPELSAEETARIIARAHGEGGPNADYLRQTIAQLDTLGLSDRSFRDLLLIVERLLPGAG